MRFPLFCRTSVKTLKFCGLDKIWNDRTIYLVFMIFDLDLRPSFSVDVTVILLLDGTMVPVLLYNNKPIKYKVCALNSIQVS